MRYVFSILACTSFLALSGGAAFAENSVRSPLNSWSLHNVNGGENIRSCELGNQFEGGFKLGFVSEQSRIKNIVITGEGASSSSVLSSAALRVTPGFKASVDVQKIDDNLITIDVSKHDGLFFALQSGYLLEIEWPNTDKHVFSLTGVKTHLRKLQSCSGVDWEGKKNIVSFKANDDLQREPEAPSTSMTTQIATAEPTQINSVSKDVPKKQPEPKQAAIHKVEAAPTRIHKPGFIIAPPSQQELVKPPEFDVDKLSQEEIANRQNSQQPQDTYALARKNDFEQEIYWDENNIKGQPKRVLSQSRQEAEAIPVIVPAIEDNPKRIDLMNTDREQTYISNQELERQVKLTKAIQRPISDQGNVSAQDAMPAQPVASVESVIDQPRAAVSSQWFAKTGQSVRDVLVEWSLSENVELVWDSDNQFKVLKNLNINKSYEDAVAALLGQYMHENVETRPVGQLYVDPNDGRKVLIIHTN